MARSNQPPKPECCRTEGQAQTPAAGAEDRTTVWKHTQGDSQAASGSRTPLKQFSLETIQNNAGGATGDFGTCNPSASFSAQHASDQKQLACVAQESRARHALALEM